MKLSRIFCITALMVCGLMSCSSNATVAPSLIVSQVKITGIPPHFGGTGVGAVMHLGVVGLDSAGDTVSTSLPAVWSSADSSVARIDQSGTLTMLKVGGVKVRVSVLEATNVLTDSVSFGIVTLTSKSP